MNLRLFVQISFAFMLIPLVLGGFSFLPKALWPLRHAYFASILVFLISLGWKSFRNEVKLLFHNPSNIFNEITAKRSIQYLQWIFLFAFIKIVLINFYSFSVLESDFSYFDLMLANFMRGKGWFSQACNCNHFGVHSTYHFYLLAPIHRLFNSPLFLVIIHAVGLWVSVFPLKKIMKHFKILPIHQVMIVFAFFNFSATSHILKNNFHMEVFYVPLFLYLLYFLETKKWPLFYIFVLLCLSIKEDAGFYLIGVAAAMFLCKKNVKSHAFALAILSVLVTALSLKYVIPSFRETQQYIIAGKALKYGVSMKDHVFTLLSSPSLLIKDLFASSWWKLLLAPLFTPLLIPFFIIAVTPFVIIHATAGAGLMSQLVLYYSAPYLPFIFYAFINYLGTGGVLKHKYIPTTKHITYFILFFVFYGSLFGSGFLTFRPIKKDAFSISEVKQSVKEGSKVCAQASILPHLGYDFDLWPLKYCHNKKFDVFVLNSHLKWNSHDSYHLNDIIAKLDSDNSYLKQMIGNFKIYHKKSN